MTRTTLRDLWAHKRRLISTCIAVLLGVAFMSGTLVLTSTINSVFDDLFAAGTKGTDAVVRGPVLFKSERGGEQRDRLPEDVVTKVRAVPGVAAASPAIASFEFTLLNKKGDPMGGAGPPTIIGSWDTDPTLNPYQVVSGRAPEANGEAVINRAAANDGPFEVGDTLVLVTPEGQQKLKLVGISRFGDADSSGGVISVATTLAQAQTLAGASNKLDQVNARAKAGISPDQLVTQLRAAKVAPGANVITGEALAKEQATDLKDVFGFFSKILLTFAFIALFVGIFIISNTFSILLAQRTKQLALMRALGASRRQVLGSVLLEAGIIGVISALLGFVAGVGLAQAAFVLLRKAGLDLPSTGLTITAGNAAVSILVGLAITAGSAMLPAIRATRVPPIAALQDVATDESDRSRFRAAAGAVAAVIGVVLLLPSFGSDQSTDRLPTIGLGMALVVVAVLILGPVYARPLSNLVGSPLPKLKGVTGRLSRQNATRNPRRTASTASALIIGVTLIGFITIFANSAQSSVTKSISGGFKGDYIVQPASQQTFAGAGPELSERMAKVPGVADVTAIAGAEALLELPDGTKSPAILAGIDPATYTKLFDAKMERGALTDLRDGQIVVDRQVAEKNKLSIGDSVKLTGRNGATLTFKVAAISDERVLLGQWSTTRADASRLTEQPTDFLVAIKAAAGTTPASLRPELKKIAKDFPTMKLQDREEFTGSIVTQISALLNVIYGLLAVSVVIALIGIANTLSLSIHERTREVGLLRATGMTRRQLRSSVRWEAVIVALMGTGIGLLLGLGLSFTLIQALKSQGFNTFAIPVGGLVTVVVFGAAVGVIASIRPASKAAKLNVLEAISSE